MYRKTKGCLLVGKGERGHEPGCTVWNIKAVVGLVTGLSPFLNFRVIQEIAASQILCQKLHIVMFFTYIACIIFIVNIGFS